MNTIGKRTAITVLALSFFFTFASCSTSPQKPASGEIPQACKVDCVTNYGEILGTSPDGQAAFSNCKSNCVVFQPNFIDDRFTGIKWQCVEYARRWLLTNKGMVYGDVDIAADIWGKITYFTVIEDGSQVSTVNILNGATETPQVGDLLVYGKDFLGTGHVAVVTEVGANHSFVKVAEQNFANAKWPGNYARTIDIVEKNGRFWLLDPYILGWKRAKV